MTWQKTNQGTAQNPVPEQHSEVQHTDKLSGKWTTLVSSTSDLESAFANVSAGDTISIAQPDTPYRPTQWLDIDVDNVRVVAESAYAADGSPIIKVADGANVGGIRVGHTAHCEHVTIENVGYHGNSGDATNGYNQDQTADRLHGIIVRDATDVTINNCFVTRTSPRHEHNTGGSGISVEEAARDVTVTNNEIDDIGDRGIQVSGENVLVQGNVSTNGFDRGVSLNVTRPDGTQYAARDVVVTENLIRDNSEGSCIGIGGTAQRSNRGEFVITNNLGFGDHRRMVLINLADVQRITITGNVGAKTAATSNRYGIYVGPSVAQTNDATVGNNYLYGYGKGGILMNAHGSVIGNHIEDVGGSGIVLDKDFASAIGNLIWRPSGHGIHLNATRTSARGNTVWRAGDSDIRAANVSPLGTIVGNHLHDGNQNASASAPIHVAGGGAMIGCNRITSKNNTAFVEESTADGNLWVGNRASGGGGVWSLSGPNSVAEANKPAIDVHRGLADGDSNNSISVTFDKPYASRPVLNFGRRGGGITGISYTTDANANYDGATVSISTAGGTIDATVAGESTVQ